jgi:hypothetical protein
MYTPSASGLSYSPGDEKVYFTMTDDCDPLGGPGQGFRDIWSISATNIVVREVHEFMDSWHVMGQPYRVGVDNYAFSWGQAGFSMPGHESERLIVYKQESGYGEWTHFTEMPATDFGLGSNTVTSLYVMEPQGVTWWKGKFYMQAISYGGWPTYQGGIGIICWDPTANTWTTVSYQPDEDQPQYNWHGGATIYAIPA